MNEIQRSELKIFKEVKKILDKHHLKYFAIGGTCIGAVRHKGFIPWDDDIDIALPRKDYELFRTQYCSELPDCYRILDYDNCSSHNYLFFKIFDVRNTYVEENYRYDPDRFTGTFIDIMPVDNIPYDNEKNYIKKINHYAKMDLYIRPRPHELTTASQKIRFFCKKILQHLHRVNYYSDKIRDFSLKLSSEPSKKVYFTWRFDLEQNRVIFNKHYFDEIIEVPFEDTTIMIPKGYNEYLTQDFGDYMKLPPDEEQRSIHSVYISDMNKPYSYYAELKRKGEL